MGAFAGMRDAKMYETGTPLTQGVYTLEITKCILKNTRKSGLAFIAELTVLESNNPAHPVGSKRSWFQKMADLDVAHGSLKIFAAAVLGFDPMTQKEEIKAKLDPEIEAIMDAACDEGQQVFRGKRVAVECVPTTTKEKKLPFTRHNWAPAKAAA